MDILKSLNDVTNLDEYISLTHEVNSHRTNLKVQINITTVLTLKKIRSFEIEYLNKCDENGIACIILEHLLALPPSKAWGSGIGNELISLIRYWLEAVRKHLLNHSRQWWTFLKQLLKFIKNIRLKAPSMPNLLVEHLTECLLDIATSDLPDAFQRHEILHALNVCCAESSREIRFVMRNQFADYFVKLASQMASSGYLPYQYSVLECLVRWLVPRQQRLVRAAAADKWFPPDLYPNEAVQIFKQTTWINFFKDARDFLNALNVANGLVTSVVCRRLSVGDTFVISGSEKSECWLDVNSTGPCLSVLLDPRSLETFGVRDFCAAFALAVTTDDILTMQLHSNSGITLSITTENPPSIRPSDIKLGDDKRTITVSLSSRTDLLMMDNTLRRLFHDKYQLQLDLNSQVSVSPPRSIPTGRPGTNSEEDTRFSHPVEVKRKRHFGDKVRSRCPRGVNTPSSASTSSITQLYEKLAALPRYNYDKKRESVCIQPALSHVSEISERDDRSILSTTTLKYQPCGLVQYRKLPVGTLKSQSDSEAKTYCRKDFQSQSDTEATKAAVVSDNEVSLLLTTTIGSTDDTVINETVERLSKKKGFDRQNIVDLLVVEALQEQRDKGTDSGINTDDNKKSQDTEENSEAIEGTPVLVNEKVKKSKLAKKKVCTVVSKSTTDDESNTEVVNETPTFVTSRNRNKGNVKPDSNSNTLDFDTVENFFSQHYTANREGDVVISPTLAKKINETSSESSTHFDDCMITSENFNPNEEIFQFNFIDVIECLNDVVDEVCHKFEKCSEYLRDKTPDNFCPDKSPVTQKRSTKSPVVGMPKTTKTKAQSKPKREIKIKFKATPEKQNSKRVLAKKNKIAKQSPPKKMSTITEQTDEEEVGNEVRETNKAQSPVNMKDSTPLVRRKRKLYSPKDNEIQIEKTSKIPTSDTDEDALLSELKTKNTTRNTPVSCYKEIENERKMRTRSKSRISKGKVQKPPSPRTLKMNETFDTLKKTVEGPEKIVLVDKTNKKLEIYNFTSDSDDDDFKKKKIEINKKISSTTVTSTNSKASNRRGRKKNYSESKSSNDEAKKPPVKRKPPAKRTTRQKAVTIERDVDLVDEKMREATVTINSSLVIEDKPQNKESPNIELKLNNLPEMEPISDTEEPKKVESSITFPKQNNKKPETVLIKKERNNKITLKPASDKDDNGSVTSSSPLPGLVVEPIPSRKDDANDSITANMAQKFKKIYQDGPDQNESNITQNMLSDIEHNSQRNVGFSVTDEIRVEYDNLQVVEGTNKTIKGKSEFDPPNEIQVSETYKPRNIKKSTKAKVNVELKSESLQEEIIEISEDKPSRNSSMSIATDGINAHNDSEAAPPSPDTIKETFRPREIEDLDQSTTEYYRKLTKEINRSNDDSKEKSTSEINNGSVDKSPIVAVKRLSIDDIGKYLPSTKSSTPSFKKTPVVAVKNMSLNDIDKYQSQRSSYSRTEKSPIRKRVPDDISKYLPSLRTTESGSSKSKSPVVKVVRISLEEFDKWLPPIDKIPDLISQPSPKKINIPAPEYERSTEKRKTNLRLIFKSNKETSRDSNSSEKSTRILKDRTTNTNQKDTNEEFLTRKILTRSYSKKIDASKTRTLDDALHKESTKRKSNIISPVKSFEEFVNNLQPSEDSDEENIAKKRKIAKPEAPKSTDSKITDNLQPSDNEFAKIGKFAKPKPPKDPVPVVHVTSMKRASSPIRVSEREINIPTYEEVASSEDVPSKKSKYDDDVVTSGPSVPSVHDWFKRTEASTKGKINESAEDAIKFIMEKLDTTLVELDHNTDRKFVNLFIEVQSQLACHKEEKSKMYQNMRNDLMEYIDKKINDFSRKSQEMDAEFMVNFKQQAFEVLKQNCKQKRAMVALLKEDVQSILGRSKD